MTILMFVRILTFTLLLGGSTWAKSPRVEADLKRHDSEIATLKKEFARLPADTKNKAWVQKKIQHMADMDQKTRRLTSLPDLQAYSKDERIEFSLESLKRMNRIDDENAAEMKTLLAIYHWMKISQFGKATDENAWLLVQHFDRHPDFQREILARLEKLWPLGETRPGNVAYLFDRVAASWSDPSKRTLQRYGTQGLCENGGWTPIPMEEPTQLDARRREMGLEPFAEYLKKVSQGCPKV